MIEAEPSTNGDADRMPDLNDDSSSRWFVAGYAGLAGFFAVEAVVRERGSASSLTPTERDQGSTQMIVAAYVLAAILSPLLRRLPVGRMPRATAPAGLVLQAVGLGLRIWSMRTLRGSYSRTLRTETEQEVVDDGPYRMVRHPGYLGSLMTWLGFALTSRSLPVIGVVGGLLARAYSHRIRAEETLLERELPGYREYRSRTWRLVPGLW